MDICTGNLQTRDELLARLAGLRQAPIDQKRAPHKPLLLLWLFGQFAATGSSAASYQQAEEPVSQLINDFGPPVASPALARQRAAMPFVHLERDLWDLRDATGQEIGRSDRLSSGRSVRARPPASAMACSHLNAMSFMQPRTLRSAVLANRTSCCSRSPNVPRRHLLAVELPPDEAGDQLARGTQRGCHHVGLEDREQRGRVGQ